MGKQLVFVVVVILSLVSVRAVFAMGECDRYQTPYDRTYCMGKLFVESDKELNVVYRELRGMLQPEVKRMLAETQRAWISYRDTACQDNPGTIDVDCNYRVNRARTEYLRDRLRECKTGNVRTNMIVKKSW